MLNIRTYRFNFFILIVLVVLLVYNCSSYKKAALNYVDSYEIPPNFEFQKTKVGGLSGVDYDANNNTFCLVSDDRSEHGPARFYVASISVSG